MRKKNYKGRSEKRVLGKCEGVCKTYDPIQHKFADILQSDNSIIKFQCNIPLNVLETGEYTLVSDAFSGKKSLDRND